MKGFFTLAVEAFDISYCNSVSVKKFPLQPYVSISHCANTDLSLHTFLRSEVQLLTLLSQSSHCNTSECYLTQIEAVTFEGCKIAVGIR